MPIYEIVFYLFSAVLMAAAVMVVTVRNPVYAALSLVLAFFSSAAIWMLLEVEFLAIILVLVYVGAVLVLFLFVVMMLDINLAPLKEGFARYLPAGVVVALVAFFSARRFAAPIAEQIWDMKYRLKDASGTPLDATPEDSWRRVARALASLLRSIFIACCSICSLVVCRCRSSISRLM
mgnify:CR=1 FL=1